MAAVVKQTRADVQKASQPAFDGFKHITRCQALHICLWRHEKIQEPVQHFSQLARGKTWIPAILLLAPRLQHHMTPNNIAALLLLTDYCWDLPSYSGSAGSAANGGYTCG